MSLVLNINVVGFWRSDEYRLKWSEKTQRNRGDLGWTQKIVRDLKSHVKRREVSQKGGMRVARA